MKDLKKMREKFELELKLAKFSNLFEKKFNVEPIVIESDGKIICSCVCGSCDAGKILREITPDEKITLNDTAMGKGNETDFYRITREKYRSDVAAKMKIEFISGGKTFWLKIIIDKTELEKFFVNGKRELASYEVTYRDGQKIVEIPCKNFRSRMMEYSGPTAVLLDHEEIKNIVEFLKRF